MMREHEPDEFKKALGKSWSQNIVYDFWHLIRTTGKWWLVPVITLLLIGGALMLLGGTAAAPFIYTLF